MWSTFPVINAENFLDIRKEVISTAYIRGALELAMESVQTNGPLSVSHHETRKVLEPLFRVLPKNERGRIEGPMLRHALHRYFLQRYSITVRGLEASLNKSSLVGKSEIYRDRVPLLVESILEGHYASDGFGLDDAAAIAVVLDGLIMEPSDADLGSALALRNRELAGSTLTRNELELALVDHTLQWLVGDEAEVEADGKNRRFLEDAIPKWQSIEDFVRGEVDRLEHGRRAGGSNPFTRIFTPDDFRSIAKGITSGFGTWWEQECQNIKTALVKEDPNELGRVRLSDFYKSNDDGEWRFGESEAYLRDLGAIDHTSRSNGPQVIIPNYLLGPNNCIVSSTFYLVCCVNECEALLGQVEQAVQAPVALPEHILAVVGNMTEDSQQFRLQEALADQLKQIAKKHRGKVPLHGRLFAQWMHYVFPQECPYPHPVGAVSYQTTMEYGDSSIAEPSEMKEHAKKARRRSGMSAEESEMVAQELMSQWTDEEELLSDYAELRPPRVALDMPVGAVLVAVALVGALFVSWFMEKFGDSPKLSTGSQFIGGSSSGMRPAPCFI